VRRLGAAFALGVGLAAAAALAQTAPAPAPPPAATFGEPAPTATVAELRKALDEAVARFNARDAAGVLAYVSDQYRTGGVTKAALAEQLRTIYAVHDQVRARIHLDDVRMLGGQAWIYTTGDVVGHLRLIGGTIPVFTWQRELEVAHREAGGWRLIGDGS
jgi:hypothetical protein